MQINSNLCSQSRTSREGVSFISIPYYVGLAHPLQPGQFYPVQIYFRASCTTQQVIRLQSFCRGNEILTRSLLFSPLRSTDNATRYCHLNGMWDNYTNYDNCHHIADSNDDFDPTVELPTYIYCLGYLLSLISLALAVFVFIRFK